MARTIFPVIQTECEIFVIAHRLLTIRDADVILFMENVNIIEQGNHKELLKQKGAYSTLYYSQFA